MTSLDLHKYLPILVTRINVMLYPNLGNENSDVGGHITCAQGPLLARVHM